MEKIDIVRTETESLLKKIVSQYTLEVVEDQGAFQVVIKTEEAPTLIGRHGDTVRAFQKILEVMMFQQFKEPVRLLINVNDYREKQTERLNEMAREYAQKTLDTKMAGYISDLSSYERRVIHQLITAEFPDLASYSVGEGRDRQLVIDLKENVPQTTTQE
ncbi:MAG: R3H domain-containing nucleic acid-binding protein [Microgenomates group bacterium]